MDIKYEIRKINRRLDRLEKHVTFHHLSSVIIDALDEYQTEAIDCSKCQFYSDKIKDRKCLLKNEKIEVEIVDCTYFESKEDTINENRPKD